MAVDPYFKAYSVFDSPATDHEEKTRAAIRLCRQKLKVTKDITCALEMVRALMEVQCLLYHAIKDHCVGRQWPPRTGC